MPVLLALITLRPPRRPARVGETPPELFMLGKNDALC
jgi:hypothetical protein